MLYKYEFIEYVLLLLFAFCFLPLTRFSAYLYKLQFLDLFLSYSFHSYTILRSNIQISLKSYHISVSQKYILFPLL